MSKYLLKFPNAIPGVILFNVVDNVIVGNNFFVVVVDKTFELDDFWVRSEVLVMVLYTSDDLCSIS